MPSTSYGGVLVQGLTVEKLLRVLTDGSHVPVDLYVSDTLYVDHLLEYTAAHGIDADGVGLKDGNVTSAAGACWRVHTGGAAGETSYIDFTAGRGRFGYAGAGYTVTGALIYSGAARGIIFAPNATEAGYFASATGDLHLANDLNVDQIDEYTGAAGVTIDGLKLKDGAVGGPTNDIGTTVGATTVNWANGHIQTIVIGGAHTITVGAAGSNNKAGGRYFLYVDANGQNPSWTGVDWGAAGEPTWADNHLVMFVSPDAAGTMLGYDMGGGYALAIPA